MKKTDFRPVSEILMMLGMSQIEAVDYLKTRGVKASLGALRAWGHGTYTTPAPAIEELWRLWLAVSHAEEYGYPIPDEAPASVRARADTIAGLIQWYKDRDPDDPDRVATREENEALARGDDQ